MSHERAVQRWLFVFLFWTAVALFFSTQRFFALGGGWEALGDSLKRSLPQWYVWGLLSPLVFVADRWARDQSSSLRERILRHVPLAALLVSLYVAVRSLADGFLGNTSWEWSFSALAPQYHWNFLIYAVIVGVLIAYDLDRQARARELRASQLEARLAEARLETLQARLRPHFLFNTLNAVSAFMEKDPKTARRMMAHLGDLLRHSLESADRQEVPLAEELSTVESYLAIQRSRFEGKLEVEQRIQPEALGASVPSFILQPLVENAIEHGLRGRSTAGRIVVRAERLDGSLRITVADNGVGLESAWDANRSGFGLKSTDARLKGLYGDRARLEVRNGDTAGVDVILTLPWRVLEAT